MDHSLGGVGRRERGGSIAEGVMVGLALEVGMASMFALAVGQIRLFAWSPPIAPLGLVLVAAFAFALVATACLEPFAGPSALIGAWTARRRGEPSLVDPAHIGFDPTAPSA